MSLCSQLPRRKAGEASNKANRANKADLFLLRPRPRLLRGTAYEIFHSTAGMSSTDSKFYRRQRTRRRRSRFNNCRGRAVDEALEPAKAGRGPGIKPSYALAS